MSGLPWDNNSWDVAAEIVARKRRHMAAVAATSFTTEVPIPPMVASTIPQLAMKAIIVPGDKTSEGVLIEAVALPGST